MKTLRVFLLHVRFSPLLVSEPFFECLLPSRTSLSCGTHDSGRRRSKEALSALLSFHLIYYVQVPRDDKFVPTTERNFAIDPTSPPPSNHYVGRLKYTNTGTECLAYIYNKALLLAFDVFTYTTSKYRRA